MGHRVIRLTSHDVIGGYEVLFSPLMRAAHRACFEKAALARDDGWPTIADCLAFARLFGVSPAELAAFFGYLSRIEGGQTIWVDALRGDVSSGVARQRATRGQAVAFGFQCCVADTLRARVHSTGASPAGET